jgi:hypothetical protein
MDIACKPLSHKALSDSLPFLNPRDMRHIGHLKNQMQNMRAVFAVQGEGSAAWDG